MPVPGSIAFVLLLGALVAVTALSIDISLPAIPSIAAGFDSAPEAAQLTLSAYLIGFALGQLFCGPFADRFGRKPVVVWGIGLFFLAGLGCALSPSLEFLVAMRFVQGVGGSFGPVVGRAIVRDLFDREEGARILSYITLVMTLAPMLAPLIGGAMLLVAGWRTIFLVLALYGVALCLISAFKLRETLDQPDPHAISPARLVRNIGAFTREPRCLANAFVLGVTFAGMFAYVSGSPVVIIEVFGFPSQFYGFFFAASSAALMAASLASGRLGRRFGSRRLLDAGQVAVALGAAITLAAGLSGLGGIWSIMAGVCVYVFGCGLTMPNATAAALEPFAGMAGVVASLLGFVQMMAGALASLAVSALFDGTPLAMTGVLAASGALSVLAHVGWSRPAQLRAAPGG